MGKKRVMRQKLQNFLSTKRSKTCTPMHLNILCLICINLDNYIEFAKSLDFT